VRVLAVPAARLLLLLAATPDASELALPAGLAALQADFNKQNHINALGIRACARARGRPSRPLAEAALALAAAFLLLLVLISAAVSLLVFVSVTRPAALFTLSTGT
jgi:hypothetical protein